MKKLAKLVAVLAAAAPFVAYAEAPGPLPKPVAGMECLVGQWRGAGSLSMGKDTSKLDASWSCARTSAQYGVLCTLRVTGIPGLAAYEETDLMGYEPNTDTYHWYSVTNGGETHDHVAAPAAGNTLQFVFTGTQEGKPFKEVIDLTFSKDSKRVTGRSEAFLAGVSTSVMQIEMHK